MVAWVALLIPALLGLLLTYQDTLVLPLTRATDGWIDPNIPATAVLWAGFALLVFRWGGLEERDVGLVLGRLRPALLALAGLWLATELLLIPVTLLRGEPLEWSPIWSDPGPKRVLVYTFAMLVSTPLFEEVSNRAFLLPQLYLRLRLRTHWQRLALALLLSQALFALYHVPNRLLLDRMSGGELALNLLFLVVAGVFYALIYLRTANIFLAAGVHALNNAPVTLIGRPTEFVWLFLALSALLLIVWPKLHGRTSVTGIARMRRRPREPEPPGTPAREDRERWPRTTTAMDERAEGTNDARDGNDWKPETKN